MALDLNRVLKGMVKLGASDLHLKVGQKPTIRLNGQLRSVDHPTLDPADTEEANRLMMPERLRPDLDRNGSVDYSYALSEFQRFRISAYHQRSVLSLAIRRVDPEPPTLDELNLPPILGKFAEQHHGLVLVTGITGSGKSSTLAALIRIINENRRSHIITIEDPIEYLYEDDRSIIQQIEVGFDILDFPLAVRNALRQDPDIILFGELRDRETVSTALYATESGHLVLSTLHTPDAKQTILRLLQYYPALDHPLVKEQLALNLYGVISQRLLRRSDKEGMVPCCEILINTGMIRKLIREDRYDDMEEVVRTGENGMQSFDAHLLTLVQNKIVALEDAKAFIRDEGAFMRALKGKVAGGDRGRLIGS